jgi:hypothetical protein
VLDAPVDVTEARHKPRLTLGMANSDMSNVVPGRPIVSCDPANYHKRGSQLELSNGIRRAGRNSSAAPICL